MSIETARCLLAHTIGAIMLVWATGSDLVQLQVRSVDETMLSAEIVDGSLLNTGTGAAQAVKGTLNGALR